MSQFNYVQHNRLIIKDHPELNEKWVQQIIADNPSILGLGDLILKDKERKQPHSGRLDLLLQYPDSNSRFEIEIQLGKTDESHLIRTIEYWDIERKRYPQYDHTAVLVAEDITSRFLNVINLFNGFIPLVALQMNAIQIQNNIALVFTKVLDQMTLGLVDEEEDQETVDRNYWEKRGTKTTVGMTDELLNIIRTFSPESELKYNKFYIGLAKDGIANNFVVFKPQKNGLRFELKLSKSEEVDNKIDELGIDLIDYNSRSGKYKIRLNKSDISNKQEFLKDLLLKSYTDYTS